MTFVYKDLIPLLEILFRAPLAKSALLLRYLDVYVLKCLIEIAYNILKGGLPLTRGERDQLIKYKFLLKKLTLKKLSFKKKRDILLANDQLLQLMLEPFMRVAPKLTGN
jgi:hypothetical protein